MATVPQGMDFPQNNSMVRPADSYFSRPSRFDRCEMSQFAYNEKKLLRKERKLAKAKIRAAMPKKKENPRVKRKKLERMCLIEDAMRNNMIPNIHNPEEGARKKHFAKQHSILLSKAELVVIAHSEYPQLVLMAVHKDEIIHRFNSFISKPNLIGGGIILLAGLCIAVCEDSGLEFFKTIFETKKKLVDGTQIQVAGTELLDKYWLTKIFLPREPISQDQVIKKLTVQNPALNVEDWIFRSASSKESNKYSLVFKVPEITYRALGLMSFSVCYNLDTIRVVFLVDKASRKKNQTTQNFPINTQAENCQKKPDTIVETKNQTTHNFPMNTQAKNCQKKLNNIVEKKNQTTQNFPKKTPQAKNCQKKPNNIVDFTTYRLT